MGVDVPNNVNAKHWKRLREAFLRCIAARDFIGCLIVQEIMLESFAVASYARVGKVAPGSLGKTFAAIAAEEEEHVDHAMAILQSGASPGPAALRRQSVPAASGSDDHPGGDAGQGMQEWTLRSVPRQLRETVTARGQLDCSRASRSVTATVSKDARQAGATRRGDTYMGELSCQSSQARARGRFRPDRASGKLESGCGRARRPARTGACASAGRRDQGHPSLDSAQGSLPCRSRIDCRREGARRLHRLLHSSRPSGRRLHARQHRPRSRGGGLRDQGRSEDRESRRIQFHSDRGQLRSASRKTRYGLHHRQYVDRWLHRSGHQEDVRARRPEPPQINPAHRGSHRRCGFRLRPLFGAMREARAAQRAQRGAATQARRGVAKPMEFRWRSRRISSNSPPRPTS